MQSHLTDAKEIKNSSKSAVIIGGIESNHMLSDSGGFYISLRSTLWEYYIPRFVHLGKNVLGNLKSYVIGQCKAIGRTIAFVKE